MSNDIEAIKFLLYKIEELGEYCLDGHACICDILTTITNYKKRTVHSGGLRFTVWIFGDKYKVRHDCGGFSFFFANSAIDTEGEKPYNDR